MRCTLFPRFLLDVHGLAHWLVLDRVGVDDEPLGAADRTETGRADMIDLGGMLDPIFGADGVDHTHGVLGGVQPMNDIAVAAAEDLSREMIGAVGDSAARYRQRFGSRARL